MDGVTLDVVSEGPVLDVVPQLRRIHDVLIPEVGVDPSSLAGSPARTANQYQDSPGNKTVFPPTWATDGRDLTLGRGCS